MTTSSRRSRVALSTVVGLVSLTALVGCSQSNTADALARAPFGPCGSTLAELEWAAQKEGQVTLIGTPRDWANGGDVIDGFTEKYGIDVNAIYPDASSADELTIMRTWGKDPRRPDVADVTPSAANTATQEGLIEPYKATVWNSIPDKFKDPDGAWQASYAGAMSFGVETSKVASVPQTWADLTKPEYKDMITINGDPRESGSALAAVVGAALANGGSFEDISPGIRYFTELQKSGNLSSTPYTLANLMYGDIPVGLDWNYSFAGLKSDFADKGMGYEIVLPSDGLVGLPYAQVIAKNAPHPCSARLWIEYINSDEAAQLRLVVDAIPTRYENLASKLTVSPELRSALSTIEGLGEHVPSVQQLEGIQQQLEDSWGALNVEVSGDNS